MKAIIDTSIYTDVDGITKVETVQGTATVDACSLAFTECKKREDRFVLVPENPSSAEVLCRIFPLDKWHYTYYVEPDLLSRQPERPYLYLEVDDGENSDVIEFFALTKSDYEYLYGVCKKFFPSARLMTLEESYRDWIDDEFLHPCSTDSPTKGGLDKLFRNHKEEYIRIRNMFLENKSEFLETDSIELDYEKLIAYFNKTVFNALVDMTKGGQKDGKQILRP